MIIGIGGEKKHGKDTVADYLKEKYGYKKMAFADKLKTICSTAFNVPLEDCYDEDKKEVGYIIPITLHSTTALLESILIEYPIHHKDMLSIMQKLGKKNMFSSIRDMLQFVGTDILRDMVDPDYHYNSVANVFRDQSIECGVVSDCRFSNERVNLRDDFTCLLLKVVRPSLQKNDTSSHKSETSLGDDSEYDAVIINDGTLQDLYNKVDTIMLNFNTQMSTTAQ